MGKGDRKTAKGKRWRGSYGKARPKKGSRKMPVAASVAEKEGEENVAKRDSKKTSSTKKATTAKKSSSKTSTKKTTAKKSTTKKASTTKKKEADKE
ncbi:30S ribosomal protein THX [Salibacter halophilus]|uniref:30S ribosomal protein THX n=1 Tax=Salibacter halophilus TaxID=1803916 RepID=A0A6N6M8E5_9FLAO|nr:30S ribosomal protein THX [Salibacter halophilus]KAB1064930.1 30S ribosomal protein THX [Salibacter halophilus]